MGHALIEPAPTRAEQKQWTRRVSGLDRRKNGAGLHHHAGAAAKRRVVDSAMRIGGVLAQIVAAQIEQAVGTALPEQAFAAEVVDESGEDGEDVDSHRRQL